MKQNFKLISGDIALVSVSTQAIDHAWDHLAIEEFWCDMFFAPSMYTLHLLNFQKHVPALILYGNRLEVVDKFKYLSGVRTKITSQIARAKTVHANQQHI